MGSSSHGYSHTVPNPSPVIVTATVPCHTGGTISSSPQYNAGAITSTPISTNAGGFNNTTLFKLQNSSSSSSVVASPPELLLPMDFIQVLIHQHAKTIVALQVGEIRRKFFGIYKLYEMHGFTFTCVRCGVLNNNLVLFV